MSEHTWTAFEATVVIFTCAGAGLTVAWVAWKLLHEWLEEGSRRIPYRDLHSERITPDFRNLRDYK